MANPINFPLSGDVTQAINPWELWIKSVSSQMGFINIRNVTTSDYRIEQEVVEDVASYGKQLGKINDVLTMLVDKLEPENLSAKQQKEIKEYKDMVGKIDHVKQKWITPAKLLPTIDQVFDEIDTLKEENGEEYSAALARLKQGIEKLEARKKSGVVQTIKKV